jgi:hypothetical protein
MNLKGKPVSDPEFIADLAAMELHDVMKVERMHPNAARNKVKVKALIDKVYKCFQFGGYTYFVRVR